MWLQQQKGQVEMIWFTEEIPVLLSVYVMSLYILPHYDIYDMSQKEEWNDSNSYWWWNQ